MISSKKVTMKMIGEMAGVSHQTVSLVLNGSQPSRVGKATREKVLKLVRELNFTPDVRAQALVTGRTNTLAVAGTSSLATMDALMPARIYAGIGQAAMDKGYVLSFLPLQSGAKDKELVSMIQGRFADGLIVLVYSQIEEDFRTSVIPELQKAGIPVVAVHFNSNPLPCDCVGYNAVKAGQLAGEHLTARGAHTLGYIGYPRLNNNLVFQGMVEAVGTQAAVERLDLPGNYYRDSAEVGYRYGQSLVREQSLKDAYLVFSDAFALGLIKAFQEAGVSVPGDVMVMGSDDLFKPDLMLSPLTTINRKPEETGRQAAEMLFDALDAQNVAAARSFIIEPELIVRQTTEQLIATDSRS